MAQYLKVNAEDLLSLVNATDCISHFGEKALLNEMDNDTILDTISTIDNEFIIGYLEEKGYVIRQKS